jgi:hypothetical protein
MENSSNISYLVRGFNIPDAERIHGISTELAERRNFFG